MPSTVRGNLHECLLSDDVVMRFVSARNFDKSKVDEQAFSFSTPEKKSNPASLSVYQKGITDEQDLFDLLSKESPIVVADLISSEVMEIRVGEDLTLKQVEIRWSPASDNPQDPIHTCKGVDGHAGIFMLNVHPEARKDKNTRMALRIKLADLADKTARKVSKNFTVG